MADLWHRGSRPAILLFLLSSLIACQSMQQLPGLLFDSQATDHTASLEQLTRLEDDLRRITDIVIMMRTLAIAGANGTCNAADRHNMALRLQRYLAEIKHIQASSNANQQALLAANQTDNPVAWQLIRADGSPVAYAPPPADLLRFSGDEQIARMQRLTMAEANDLIGSMDQLLEALLLERTRARRELQLLQQNS